MSVLSGLQAHGTIKNVTTECGDVLAVSNLQLALLRLHRIPAWVSKRKQCKSRCYNSDGVVQHIAAVKMRITASALYNNS
jgi:hypothetical protein